MKAVILAGGKGTRLAPYTTILPKPLMPIVDLPIIEIVIQQLVSSGVDEITIAVGYLAGLMMAYLGDGTKLGVRINYSLEDKPLGTAGPIGLISNLDEPFILMNGDLLTTLDYRLLWEYHNSTDSVATLATYKRDVKIDLGVLEYDEKAEITGYIEKPTYNFAVSTGIYCFSPLVLRYIPYNKSMDLPDLVQLLISEGMKVSAYEFSGYWLDIGRQEDYETAQDIFSENREKFIGVTNSKE